MTDQIDLDDIDAGEDDEPEANEGDWFWRDAGEPAGTPDPEPADVAPGPDEPDGPDQADQADERGESGSGAGASGGPVPHVPRENKNDPVGIPKEQGGAGGGAAADTEDVAEHPDADGAEPSGPHGGGVDDMTMALTYDAVKRFADPQAVIREAGAWADWIGIVGDVETFVISSFQRQHGVDVDFFSGSGQSPAERLADIDDHSMFYAERMVVVGPPEAEAIAEQANWEFVPLSEAAGKADWELTDG